MSDFNERIERFAELEAKTTPGEWWIEEHDGDIYADPPIPIVHVVTGPDADFVGQLDSDNDQEFVCAIRNEGLPLLKEIHGALLEEQQERQIWEVSAKANEVVIDSQNEQILFLMGANSAFIQEIESLRAENKQLKENIAQAELFIGLIESHGLEYALSKVVKA